MGNGKKVYIITEYLYKTESYKLFATAFDTMDKAVRFILEHLSEEEMNKNERLHRRQLLTSNEYLGDGHSFKISELDFK